MDIIEKRNHTLIIIAEKLAPYVESFTFDRAAMSNGEVVKDSIQVNGANNVWSSGIITTNNGPVGAALVGSSTSTYKITLKDDTPADSKNSKTKPELADKNSQNQENNNPKKQQSTDKEQTSFSDNDFEIPKTDDKIQISGFLGAMLLSILGILGINFNKKKEEYNEDESSL